MNKPLIIANWKMNKTLDESINSIEKIKGSKKVSLVICPPYIALNTLHQKLKGRSIKLGAQNVYFEDFGDYTGEISPSMLKGVGCEYVIIGHSERRRIFHENEDTINNKILVSLSYGLKVVLCVGESLNALKNGISEDYVSIQLSQNLYKVKNFENLTIVYEPVWAKQTNMDVNIEHINRMINYIYKFLKDNFAINPNLLYGGKIRNEEIITINNIESLNGFLVEDLSLNYKLFNNFIKIIESTIN